LRKCGTPYWGLEPIGEDADRPLSEGDCSAPDRKPPTSVSCDERWFRVATTEQAVTTAAVEDKLEQLKTTANRQHLLVKKSGAVMLDHAVRAGEALVAIKAEVGHGEWGTWLEENFVGSERTAQVYMQLAENPQRSADLPEPSIQAALRAISRKPPEREPSPGGRVSSETAEVEPVPLRERVLELREKGDAPATIARKLIKDAPGLRVETSDVNALLLGWDLIAKLGDAERARKVVEQLPVPVDADLDDALAEMLGAVKDEKVTQS
jgi:DUF3102 family protein